MLRPHRGELALREVTGSPLYRKPTTSFCKLPVRIFLPSFGIALKKSSSFTLSTNPRYSVLPIFCFRILRTDSKGAKGLPSRLMNRHSFRISSKMADLIQAMARVPCGRRYKRLWNLRLPTGYCCTIRCRRKSLLRFGMARSVWNPLSRSKNRY